MCTLVTEALMCFLWFWFVEDEFHFVSSVHVQQTIEFIICKIPWKDPDLFQLTEGETVCWVCILRDFCFGEINRKRVLVNISISVSIWPDAAEVGSMTEDTWQLALRRTGSCWSAFCSVCTFRCDHTVTVWISGWQLSFSEQPCASSPTIYWSESHSLLKLSRTRWKHPAGFMWQLQPVVEWHEGLCVQLKQVRPRHWLLPHHWAACILVVPVCVYMKEWGLGNTPDFCCLSPPSCEKQYNDTADSQIDCRTVTERWAETHLNTHQTLLWSIKQPELLFITHWSARKRTCCSCFMLSDVSRDEAGSQTQLNSDYTPFYLGNRVFVSICLHNTCPVIRPNNTNLCLALHVSNHWPYLSVWLDLIVLSPMTAVISWRRIPSPSATTAPTPSPSSPPAPTLCANTQQWTVSTASSWRLTPEPAACKAKTRWRTGGQRPAAVRPSFTVIQLCFIGHDRTRWAQITVRTEQESRTLLQVKTCIQIYSKIWKIEAVGAVHVIRSDLLRTVKWPPSLSTVFQM